MAAGTLIRGNELFQSSYFKENEKELIKLAKHGQRPKALYIGCSDSRVIPDLMMQSKPGDLFVIRNVGNFVAPYRPDEDYHSTAAAIEYAVSVLKVEEIIICGHTHCGACKALYETIVDPEMIHIKHWLKLGEKAKKMAIESLGVNAEKEKLLRLTEQFSVVTQLENLLTYPSVQRRVKSGEVHIHGWYYDIENGNIDYYDPEQSQFLPISALEE
ncbi:MAG: carbonic anhydrase [Helicobacteraceae bacterium]|nr:carbonic anhydrase [Helicobacteraceae bacterium]